MSGVILVLILNVSFFLAFGRFFLKWYIVLYETSYGLECGNRWHKSINYFAVVGMDAVTEPDIVFGDFGLDLSSLFDDLFFSMWNQ